MYSRSLSALAFVADFPPAAPEFHQRTYRVRLRNLAQLTKNHLTKSSTERFRKYIGVQKGRKDMGVEQGRLEKQKGWQR